MITKFLSVIILIFMMTQSNLLSQEESIFPYDSEVYTLDNGLKAIMIPSPSNGIVAYYTLVRTGARDEYEKGKTGFAHFFEHMMFRGTEKYPGPVYDSLVISIGASANAYTTDDYTAYHLNVAKEDLDLVMELESDRFQNLSYKEPEFKTEAGAVYGEYRKNITNPVMVLWEKLKNTAFTKHTYSHTTIGYVEDIKAMPTMYDYSKEFYKNYYRPENCILVIVGDINNEELKGKIDNYYGSWEKGYNAPDVKEEPKQMKPRSAEVVYPGKTNPIVAVGYKADAFDPANKEVVARELIADLAFGANSDLYKKLYLEEQKVQFLEPFFQQNRDPFLSLVYAMVNSEEDINYVKNEIFKTIERFQTEKVDSKVLEDTKKRQKYSFLMSLDTPDHIAGNLARFIAITGGLESVDTYFNTMMSITPEDIMEAAKGMVEKERTVITLTGGK